MWNNKGIKIKLFAKILFVIELVSVIISAFCMAMNSFVIESIVVTVVGLLTAVISLLLIYGFGEIIEKLCLIEENTRNNNMKQMMVSSVREENLQRLLDEGLITQTEYQQAMSK